MRKFLLLSAATSWELQITGIRKKIQVDTKRERETERDRKRERQRERGKTHVIISVPC